MGQTKNKVKDLTGQKFGRLTVVERDMNDPAKRSKWICRCDCGNVCSVYRNHLKSGQTTSCGCYASEVHKKSVRKMVSERKKYYVENTDIIGIHNRSIPKNNTSGCMGVNWDNSVKVWKAMIVFQGRRYYLGSSRDYETAVQLRKNAEEKIYGDFIQWYAETYPERWAKMQEQSDQLK